MKKWLPAVALLLFPLPATADLEGRISTYNVASIYGGTAASTQDAVLFRAWLMAEEINGKNLTFHLDARAELGLLTPDNAGLFNDRCRGETVASTDCDRPRRHAVLGDLDRIAGIYDAYLDFGGGAPGRTGLILGRRTVYEAGALTVDGLDVRRETEKGRIGGFAGIAPDPLTGVPNPDYQAGGLYYASAGRNALIRLAAAAQFFEFKPDLVYIYTQDFFRLSKGLTMSTIAQLDFVPFVADRIILLDLTYRTGPKWRVRLNLQRNRSTAFDQNPLFAEELRKFAGDLHPNLPIPESKDFAAATTYHQLRLITQFQIAQGITSFVKVGVRQRTVDNSTGPLFEVGATMFSRTKYPVSGIVRYRYSGGFDSTDHSVSLDLWRKLGLRSPITVGGAFTYVASTNTGLDPAGVAGINPKISNKYNVSTISGFFRYDVARYAFFAEYELANPSDSIQGGAQAGTAEGDPNPPKAEHLLILGVTMRFGQGAKKLF